uniref:AAA+ ATPase domain-containing protein n=1 Tax=Ditylenchus dipsaci TaxID=166011 RepID=A0A915DE52_9BILA
MVRSQNRKKTDRKRDSSVEEEPVAKRRACEWAMKAEVPSTKFSSIGGCEDQILEACGFLKHLYFPELYAKLGIIAPKGFILHGPPGTGKTLFARALAGQFSLNLIAVSSTELVGGISGESERRIRELFAQAADRAPAILLLDDVDRRMVAQLIASLDELENKKVLVIGTTSRLEVLDGSLRRAGRFDKDISLGIPDKMSRLKILEIATKGMKMHCTVSLESLASLTPGYCVDRVFKTYSLPQKFNGLQSSKSERFAIELERIQSWFDSPASFINSKLDEVSIEECDFHEALSVIVPSAKREGFATVPDVRWSDIGALQDIRKELEWSILKPIKHPELFETLDYSPRPQGILLCGPPGCGKTLLGKAIANETGMSFISVKGPELLSMYVGESERAVRTIFQRAKDSSPCVIFFDEIDALCPRRSHNESSGKNRKEVFLIGATNRPDMVDPAILRPGRLDRVLYVGFPSTADKVEILGKITKDGKHPRISPKFSFALIAERLEVIPEPISLPWLDKVPNLLLKKLRMA